MARRAQQKVVRGRLHIDENASLRGDMLDLIELREKRRSRRATPSDEEGADRELRLVQRAEEGLVMRISIEEKEQAECDQWAQRAKTRATTLSW